MYSALCMKVGTNCLSGLVANVHLASRQGNRQHYGLYLRSFSDVFYKLLPFFVSKMIVVTLADHFSCPSANTGTALALLQSAGFSEEYETGHKQ